jgi:hypothetical protein
MPDLAGGDRPRSRGSRFRKDRECKRPDAVLSLDFAEDDDMNIPSNGRWLAVGLCGVLSMAATGPRAEACHRCARGCGTPAYARTTCAPAQGGHGLFGGGRSQGRGLFGMRAPGVPGMGMLGGSGSGMPGMGMLGGSGSGMPGIPGVGSMTQGMSGMMGGSGYGMPGAPGYGAPGYGAPGYGAPGYGAPGYGAPGYGAPGIPGVRSMPSGAAGMAVQGIQGMMPTP